MLLDPIHPMIVHFPIALSVLVPLAAVMAFLLARRGLEIRTLWLAVTGLALILAVSSWLAVRTGEDQEEKVEAVVAEQPLETHEERGKRFLLLSGGVLVLMAAGLFNGRPGKVGRAAGTVASLLLLPAGWLVGHSGGELVYRHGAASAYVPSPPTAPDQPARDRHDDRD